MSYRVSANFVLVRSGAQLSSEAIGRLPHDARIELVEKARETKQVYLRCGVQKVQDVMLAVVQGRVQGGAGRCREVQGGAGAVQGGAGACTTASIISGAGRCRGCRHTSE